MHTNYLTLTMPEGLSPMSPRYCLLIEGADAIYDQHALEHCFRTRDDIHNSAYSVACENFILGYLGLSLGSVENQSMLSPGVKEVLLNADFTRRLAQNANLLLQVLAETDKGYTPSLVYEDDIHAMTKNAFANDVLIQIDGREGLEYSAEADQAFRFIAEFWGSHFERVQGHSVACANDNRTSRYEAFVDILEGNLREMGLMNIQNNVQPHGALVMALRAAEIEVKPEDFSQQVNAGMHALRYKAQDKAEAFSTV